ncbi:MAG: ribosome biogenesis GTPase Der [Chloroflexi bacterium]|nr:ribosome biogenesis GTPase Der [Chloroflexota bacterium]
MAKPLVAIVGRPNVGKSALFNRIVGRPVAIVADIPGTTRDRIYGDAHWEGREFTLIDTGGLLPGEDEGLIGSVQTQAQIALEEADVVLFLVDAAEGIAPLDQEVADLLRRSRRPVILLANKADNEQRAIAAAAFYGLGLGEPLTISAYHNLGIMDMLDRLVAFFPSSGEEPTVAEALGVAILGRPNVGKSSLLNRILGQERAIVDAAPGTTRDAVDTLIEYAGSPVVLIDTAGIRRRGRIIPGLEKYSVLRALRALHRADIAILVLDAIEGATAQDAHIAAYAVDLAKGLVIALNKADLLPPDREVKAQAIHHAQERFHFVTYAPIRLISAATGEGIAELMTEVQRVGEERHKRIATAALNPLIRDLQLRHGPPSRKGRTLRIYYATQAEVNPPTFVFFVNDAELVTSAYQRYLENRLREIFGFHGTGLRMIFRARERQATA